MKIKICFFIVLSLLFVSCGSEDWLDRDEELEGAKDSMVEILSVEKIMGPYDKPGLMVTFKNTSTVTFYNFSCVFNAIKDDTVIDTVTLSFVLEDDFKANQTIVGEGTFDKVLSHDEYTSLGQDCTWSLE